MVSAKKFGRKLKYFAISLSDTSSDEKNCVRAGSEAESKHPSTYHETTENQIEGMEIQSGEFVLVMEDEKRGKKFYSVGEVNKVGESEVEARYFTKVAPFQKYVAIKASYQFEKWQVAKKLPHPEPTGQTERQAGQFIFLIDMSVYNVL